jgi:hypothetical protein
MGKVKFLPFCKVCSCFEAMIHSHVIAENPIVWASSVARLRLISLGWMTFTSMVRLRANSLIPNYLSSCFISIGYLRRSGDVGSQRQ